MDNLYAVILAGGSGTRLWPRSRTNRPKQFLDLITDETMIQQTVKRLLPVIPLDRICFMVGEQHAAEIRNELPGVRAENIFCEPAPRGTGSCVGLAAAYLRRRDAGAVMCSLHADHFIADEDGFRAALAASYEVAQRGLLVTMGAAPMYPETGYGYIQCGEELAPVGGHHVYRIARFVEKPGPEAAQRMIESGGYLWNTGMFTWRLDAIMEAFRRWMPEFHRQLHEMAGSLDDRARLSEIWARVVNQTIDRGIMEHADNGAVVPIDIGWSDIGSWATLHDLLVADENGNVIRGQHVAIDTHKSLIQGNGKLIATIGVRDIIVVETEDAILICAKERAQEVKDIVEKLRESKRTDLL